MQWPISTPQLRELLPGTREYQFTNLIRLGKVNPPLFLGRRAWSPQHVLTVAKLLGKDSPEVRNICRQGGAQ